MVASHTQILDLDGHREGNECNGYHCNGQAWKTFRESHRVTSRVFEEMWVRSIATEFEEFRLATIGLDCFSLVGDVNRDPGSIAGLCENSTFFMNRHIRSSRMVQSASHLCSCVLQTTKRY